MEGLSLRLNHAVLAIFLRKCDMFTMLATSELVRGLCELYKMALAQLCDSEWGLFPLRYGLLSDHIYESET